MMSALILKAVVTPHLHALSHVCNGILRFISARAPAELFVTIMAAIYALCPACPILCYHQQSSAAVFGCVDN